MRVIGLTLCALALPSGATPIAAQDDTPRTIVVAPFASIGPNLGFELAAELSERISQRDDFQVIGWTTLLAQAPQTAHLDPEELPWAPCVTARQLAVRFQIDAVVCGSLRGERSGGFSLHTIIIPVVTGAEQVFGPIPASDRDQALASAEASFAEWAMETATPPNR